MPGRYVHNAAVDDPLVWYEGAGFTDRHFLHADHQGSIVAVTDSAGNAADYGAARPSGGRLLLAFYA